MPLPAWIEQHLLASRQQYKEHQNDHGWKSDYEPKYIEDTYFPKMDIQQGSETTYVKLFYKIQDYDNSDGSTIRLCPLQDVVKKLYC